MCTLGNLNQNKTSAANYPVVVRRTSDDGDKLLPSASNIL